MTDAKSAPKPVETLSFEEAMRELEAVVDQVGGTSWIVDGDVALLNIVGEGIQRLP